MEVSVWQGGIPLTRDYGAFYDQVVWRSVGGVWAPHAKAAVDLGEEGQQALAGQLLSLCRRRDACFWAAGVYNPGPCPIACAARCKVPGR